MKTSLTGPQLVLIAILVLAATPYFIGLGASSLWDSNEAFYAETPREMIESQDYINPTFNYRARFNKPPLSYWVVVPFYKVLGVSEASERLPLALGALIMIATAFGLGCALFSFDAGLLAAIGLAVAPRFLMFSRRILIDVYLAMFMGLALLLFVLAERQPRHRRLYLIAMYTFLGLGVLTKGPVALLLPALAFVGYLALYRGLARLREMMLPAGLIIIALVVLPWYVLIYLRHGWAHIENFILRDNLSRYTEQVWGPGRGFSFYVPVILGDFFPWSIFLISLLCFAVVRWVAARRNIEKNGQPAKGPAILVIWIAVIVVFFSFSRSKEDLYILPIYPAAAALVGGWLSGRFSNSESGLRFARWTSITLAAVIAAVGTVVVFLFVVEKQFYDLAGAGLIGCVLIAGGLAAAGAALVNSTRTAVLVVAMTVAACNWIFVLRTLPDFERYKPVRSLCEVLASHAGPDAQAGYYRIAYPSMVFYLRRPIFEYFERHEIEAAFSSGKEVFCLMTESDYQVLATQLPVQTRVLASRPIFQVKLRSFLSKVEPPRVVLISNKGGSSVEQ